MFKVGDKIKINEDYPDKSLIYLAVTRDLFNG